MNLERNWEQLITAMIASNEQTNRWEVYEVWCYACECVRACVCVKKKNEYEMLNVRWENLSKPP